MAQWRADARYTRLVEEHGTRLLHLAIMLTGNRHDAEDVVQDVLISVASAWPVSSPVAYLKRAVTNRSIDVMRKRRDVLTDAPPERAVEDLGFLRHEEHRRFFAMVRDLPPRQRETIVLRYYADLDDQAIAKILGCSIQTVRSQAHHALTKLRAAEAANSGKDQS
jgi:RNA polymerase sigma factor (sigma-70 family)